MDVNMSPEMQPIRPKPKFGGRFVGEKRPQTTLAPAPTLAAKVETPILDAERALASAASGEKPPKKPKKASPYTFAGECKILKRLMMVDSEGYSSKGRSRMKGRIRYQKQKVAAAYFETLLKMGERLVSEGILDASVCSLVFNDAEYAINLLGTARADATHAERYQAPTPRARKSAAIVVPSE